MPRLTLTPQVVIDKPTARRFLLFHHNLLPPRSLAGKSGVKAFFKRVGCIQYDTINVVGRNPDLVLQSRIRDYTPGLLDEMLYLERSLIDGWDKLASIYLVRDWPYFRRQRAAMYLHQQKRSSEPIALEPAVKSRIAAEGPLSSLDYDGEEHGSVHWFWGSTKLARATLELLFAKGELGIHHKVGTRRIFDLIENLLPEELLDADDPNPTFESYQDWHIARRIGSLGIAANRSGEFWMGIHKTKAPERAESLLRLCEQGKILPLSVDGAATAPLFVRTQDWAKFTATQANPSAAAAFLAPLDNLMWDRKLIAEIFDFQYTWEVYKPPPQRVYGYYVLPVLYGNRFIGRMESKFDRKTKALRILGWWWESDVVVEDAVVAALQSCFSQFGSYLDCETYDFSRVPELQALLGFIDR
ncbi:MAG: YcaQ family DNA glycosylase [Chloroflexi bacterium]|nr:YcaQ family DNA glycosylase [Chloroflexota bacterium]